VGRLKIQLEYDVGTRFGYKNLSARGRSWGAGPLDVNLRPPNVSDTTRAGRLELKTPLDMVKLAVWLSGNALASINGVALRQTRLVLGWVTVCGRVNHFGM